MMASAVCLVTYDAWDSLVLTGNLLLMWTRNAHARTVRSHRSIAPDALKRVIRTLSGVAVVLVKRVLAPFCVDCLLLVLAFLGLLALSAFVALLMATVIKSVVEKHVGHVPTTSEPKDLLASAPTPSHDPLPEAPMDVDVDPAPPRLPSPSLSPALQRLPFPGKLVDGVHEVVHKDM